MKKITLKVNSGTSNILIGESIDNLSNYLPEGRSVIITDNNLFHHYSSKIQKYEVIEIGTGEKVKTLETIQYIIGRLIEIEADRSTFIVGLGGGVVCDITGLVASVFMRGVGFGFVSTSLLSQVDASIGGKNGVNIGKYKNLFGLFRQPEFVICDIKLLSTLPDNEFISGLAEVVKYGLIQSENIFKLMNENINRILNRDNDLLSELIYESVLIKRDIVQQDEFESDSRRKLNFGHTIGHAIELSCELLHGEAISIGMVWALQISVEKLGLESHVYNETKNLLVKLGLPVEISTNNKDVLSNLRRDKKRENESVNFVLIDKVGSAVIEKIDLNEIESFL